MPLPSLRLPPGRLPHGLADFPSDVPGAPGATPSAPRPLVPVPWGALGCLMKVPSHPAAKLTGGSGTWVRVLAHPWGHLDEPGAGAGRGPGAAAAAEGRALPAACPGLRCFYFFFFFPAELSQAASGTRKAWCRGAAACSPPRTCLMRSGRCTRVRPDVLPLSGLAPARCAPAPPQHPAPPACGTAEGRRGCCPSHPAFLTPPPRDSRRLLVHISAPKYGTEAAAISHRAA